ncbi:MAG TPA: winged helix-turn-helix domain-containing protein, partial [Thalassospira sp.]|nr:winged helix-turn-helix domain-containing protein [Thalassospira sp.]
VLPFMKDGEFVARVDLKADRQEGVLRVQSAHLEDGCDGAAVAGDLMVNLSRLARFLGLQGVVVMPCNPFSVYLGRQIQG